MKYNLVVDGDQLSHLIPIIAESNAHYNIKSNLIDTIKPQMLKQQEQHNIAIAKQKIIETAQKDKGFREELIKELEK